jgi:hypothetical protein
VIAIGAILFSLIIPGIVRVREVARRQRCINRISELVLLDLPMGNKTILWPHSGNEPRETNDDQVDTKIILLTTSALFAAFSAMLGALFIRSAIRYFNRRDDRFVDGTQIEKGGSPSNGCWSCSPSSSPN